MNTWGILGGGELLVQRSKTQHIKDLLHFADNTVQFLHRDMCFTHLTVTH